MENAIKRNNNRILSFVFIAFFAMSILTGGTVIGILINKHAENQRLQDELESEMAYLQEIYSNIDDDGYYNVYSNGEYVVYGNGGSIIIENP